MRVICGPVNTAGSAYRLAHALRREGIEAESAAIAYSARRTPLTWPVDHLLPNRWATPDHRRYLARFTHSILWSGLSLRRPGRWFDEDQPVGREAVLTVGSELRVPGVHRRLEPWSPFGDDALSQRLVPYAARFHRRLARRKVPLFVHTWGMLDYADAVVLPIIGDPLSVGPLLRRKRPLVLYAPTNGLLKGARHVEATDWAGFELVRPALLQPAEMEASIRDCDIVLGGMVLGDYGLTEIQGMAAGRLVIANVGERVRAKMPEDPPIVHATPDILGSVIADVLANRSRYREIAARGPEFVERWHDGRYSVAQLRPFLGLNQVAA
jgi:hypothetical protein